MAVVKMNKVWIVGMKGKEEEILKKIMKKGFIQLEDPSYLTEKEEFKGALSKTENNLTTSSLNKKIEQIQISIDNIRRINKVKKSMFTPKNEFKELSDEEAEVELNYVKEVNEAADNVVEYKNKKTALEKELKDLMPWQKINIEKKYDSIKHISTIIGTFPKNIKIEKLNIILEKYDTTIDIVSKDKNLVYVAIVAYKESVNEILAVLRKNKFKEEHLSCTENISDKIEELENSIENMENAIKEQLNKINSRYIESFENLYDYYIIKRDISIARKNIVTSKYIFYLEGWVPANIKIKKDEDYIIQTSKPDENEECPVLLNNNSFVTPFESITNMYSYPNQKEIDPNPIMAIFFVIFFGMMLSDAGYGIILTLACLAIWKIKGYKKGEGNLIKLLVFGGISTIAWGLLFGSFFGNLVPIKPVIDPLKDVMLLMGISLLAGIIHIYAGLFMKALALIKEKQIFAAICDVGLWYVFLTGIFLVIIPVVAGDIGIWGTVGKNLAIIGGIGLILTQGRKEKNIFKKGFKGISSLYDLTGYFADVLSYSRIMALCLSTGVIAQVVNLLGQIAGPIPAIFIGLIGHTINIANSALGSYVHTSRLQYVEFFGKFYEGGGKPFIPFMCKTRYTKIREEN